MILKSSNKVVSILLLTVMIFTVLIRENIFIEINAIIAGYDYNKAYFYFFNESFAAMDIVQLTKLKWLLTSLFVFIVAISSIVIVKLWFKNKRYTKLIILSYIGIAMLGGLIFLITYAFDVTNQYYFLLRKLLGLAHSPIPLFIFFSLFYYLDKEEIIG